MDFTDLRTVIHGIPKELDSTDEWWKSSTEEDFVQAGIRMMNAGMKQFETLEILRRLYIAMCDEFGD